MKELNLMIDIETMSLEHNAAILAIGATVFELGHDPFYMVAASNTYTNDLSSLFDIDEGTMKWWKEQAEDVYTENFSGALHPTTLISSFSRYVYDLSTKCDKLNIWANGPQFDVIVLNHAFQAFGYTVPWKYSNVRDFRTLKSLVPPVVYEGVQNMAAHTALGDAIYQRDVALKCLDYLKHPFARDSNG